MTSEILEENEIRNPYMSLNGNNESSFDGLQRRASSTNFIKIKMEEAENQSKNFPYEDNSKRISKKNKDYDDYIDYSPRSRKRQDSIGKTYSNLDSRKRGYDCSYPDCGKMFTDKGSYRKHALTHGEKQVRFLFKKYPCPYENCGKKFLDNSKLRRHMLVHTVRVL